MISLSVHFQNRAHFDGLIIRKLTKRVIFKDEWVALTNEQLASIWNLDEQYPVSTNHHDEDAFNLFSDFRM